MAVFAPLKDIGLIVMDEEQESSYKADMTPKYDTVDIALKRISYYKGVLLLGAPTLVGRIVLQGESGHIQTSYFK